MPTTAWRFSGTEGADEAVLKLKQLQAAKLVGDLSSTASGQAPDSKLPMPLKPLRSLAGRCRRDQVFGRAR